MIGESPDNFSSWKATFKDMILSILSVPIRKVFPVDLFCREPGFSAVGFVTYVGDCV